MRETTEHSVEVSIVHPTSEEVHRPDGAGVPKSAPPSEEKAAPAVAQTATVEHLLYAVILAAAVLLRLIGLGREPLSPQESAAAWSAWLAANQQFVVGAPVPESALLYGLQSLLFWLIGDGDALARAIPALFGVATVLLPWFWRPWIGRMAALVVAALFAIDPWLMAFSRRSDAAALTIFLGLLTLTALWRRSHAPDARQALRWERTAAVAAALFLTSGPLMWGMLPVLAFFILIYGVDRSGAGEETPSGWLFHRSTWLWFGVPLALAATGLTLRFEALSALSASLTAWIWPSPAWSGRTPLPGRLRGCFSISPCWRCLACWGWRRSGRNPSWAPCAGSKGRTQSSKGNCKGLPGFSAVQMNDCVCRSF